MSIAGKTRDSASLRVRLSSMLPVPLNSSKITSSIFEPVSMSAVAMIVSDPPLFDLARRTEETLGLVQRRRVETARERASRARDDLVVRARQTRDRVEQDHDVLAELDETLRALHRQLGDRRVVLGMLVEGRGDDFAVDRALHVGDFFGTLVDEQRDDVRVGMVDRDRVGDVFEQRRLAGLRRRDDQRALALADRREQIDDARRELRRAHFELEPLLRIDRRAFFEDAAPFDRFRIETVDLVDANQAVILFALFRPASLALDHVAAPQFEAADLRLADVDVVVADVVAGATQEPVALGKMSRMPLATSMPERAICACTSSATISSFLSFRRRRNLDFELFGDRRAVRSSSSHRAARR